MGISNYEIAKGRAQQAFLQYDQDAIIRKFNLRADEEYLYLRFVGRWYRIDRQTGAVWWQSEEDGVRHVADFNEAMSIYDLLCDSKEGCHLSGSFTTLTSLQGTVKSAQPGQDMFAETARVFDGHLQELAEACRRLGGTPAGKGDVSYELPVFDCLPVQLQFWASDEDFPASFQMLWDTNILDFIRYETTYYVAGHLIRRIRELMERNEVADRRAEARSDGQEEQTW